MIDLLGVGVGSRHPVVVLGQRFHADASAATNHVEEQIGGDAVQPPLEGAGLVVLQRAEHPDEGFLCQVLGILLAAGKPVRQAVHAVGMLTNQFIPGRHGGLVSSGIEYCGPG
ncbi:Uncharacterised protein [Mycobacteroides abscessus subsp. abscessus]|nr:Uncharacterised protein [Mycobacteroides abscessus subsp. abscessus]